MEVKREILNDWSASWSSEQLTLIKRIESAIRSDDYDELCVACGQLKAVTEKRFAALPKIFDRLTTEARSDGD